MVQLLPVVCYVFIVVYSKTVNSTIHTLGLTRPQSKRYFFTLLLSSSQRTEMARSVSKSLQPNGHSALRVSEYIAPEFAIPHRICNTP